MSGEQSTEKEEVVFPTGDAVYFDTNAWNRLLRDTLGSRFPLPAETGYARGVRPGSLSNRRTRFSDGATSRVRYVSTKAGRRSGPVGLAPRRQRAVGRRQAT